MRSALSVSGPSLPESIIAYLTSTQIISPTLVASQPLLSIFSDPSRILLLLTRLHAFHTVLLNAAKICKRRPAAGGRYALLLISAELKHVEEDVLPQVARYCLLSLLSYNLDQTFPLSTIRTEVQTIGAQYLQEPTHVPDSDKEAKGLVTSKCKRDRMNRILEQNQLIQQFPCSNIATLLFDVCRAAMDHLGEPKSDGVLLDSFRSSMTSICVETETDDEGLLLAASSPSSLLPSSVTVTATAARKSRQRRIVLPVAQPAVKVQSLHNNNHIRVPSVTRSIGIHPLPVEIQREVLEFIPPRHVACLSSTCYLWHNIALASPTLLLRLHRSRQVRNAYCRFLRDDWGEKCTTLSSSTSVMLLDTFFNAATTATVVPRLVQPEEMWSLGDLLGAVADQYPSQPANEGLSDEDALKIKATRLLDSLAPSAKELSRIWILRSASLLRRFAVLDDSVQRPHILSELLKAGASMLWVTNVFTALEESCLKLVRRQLAISKNSISRLAAGAAFDRYLQETRNVRFRECSVELVVCCSALSQEMRMYLAQHPADATA